MMFPVLFYGLAPLILICALRVACSSNPIYAAFHLMLCFFLTAMLWLLCTAEFLALALIFVYVGAVMTLFLYVTMMINVDHVKDQGIYRAIPWFLLIMLVLGILLLSSLSLAVPAGESALHLVDNTRAIGQVLYTDYVIPFELAGLGLLLAMVTAIAIAYQKPRSNTKRQSISQQSAAKDRVTLVDLKEDK